MRTRSSRKTTTLVNESVLHDADLLSVIAPTVALLSRLLKTSKTQRGVVERVVLTLFNQLPAPARLINGEPSLHERLPCRARGAGDPVRSTAPGKAFGSTALSSPSLSPTRTQRSSAGSEQSHRFPQSGARVLEDSGVL